MQETEILETILHKFCGFQVFKMACAACIARQISGIMAVQQQKLTRGQRTLHSDENLVVQAGVCELGEESHPHVTGCAFQFQLPISADAKELIIKDNAAPAAVRR